MDVLSNSLSKTVSVNPLLDEYSRLEVIACTDLIDNHKYSVDQMPLLAARISTLREGKTGESKEKDMHLISDTLAQNKHMTPFEHVSVTFRVVAPIFVIREWQRHRVPFSYNEMSMRYVRATDADSKVFRFYTPAQWRYQSKTNKQGSSSKTPEEMGFDPTHLDDSVRHSYLLAKQVYLYLQKHEVASELCRLVLPVATYSEMYVTANIRGWYNFYELRADEAAQWEIRQYAIAIGKILGEWFPDSWKALSKWKTTGLSNDEIDSLVEMCNQKLPLQTTEEARQHVANMKSKLEKLRRRP